jgi:hypothetical protein
MDILTKEGIRRLAWDTPAVANALMAQEKDGLSDDEMYRLIISALVHENRYYDNVLKSRADESTIVRIQV